MDHLLPRTESLAIIQPARASKSATPRAPGPTGAASGVGMSIALARVRVLKSGLINIPGP